MITYNKFAVLNFINQLFSEDYFDWDFYQLLNWYMYIEWANTWILKSKHILELIRKYSFINRLELSKYNHLITDYNIRYILHIIFFICHVERIRKEYPISQEDIIRICYITSNSWLNSERIQLNANEYFSYWFSWIYTSSYTDHFSECTKDVFRDRLSYDIFYDKWVILEVDNTDNQSFMYISRKHNMSYIANEAKDFFIKNKEYIKYEPNEKDITHYSGKIRETLKSINQTNKCANALQLIISLANEIDFSFIWYLLFEIIHEYFVLNWVDIFTANQFLRILSPNQYALWSMRSFKLNTYRQLVLKCSVLLEDFDETSFCEYILEQFKYRIYLFIWWDFESLEDSIYVSLFCQRIHHIEVNWWSVTLEKNLIRKKEFDKYCSWFSVPYQIHDDDYINVSTLPLELQKKVLTQLDWLEREYFQSIFDDYNCKYIYTKVRHSITKKTLSMINKLELWCVVSNLQPDDRWEYLLIPNWKVHNSTSFGLTYDMEKVNIITNKEFILN